MKYYHYLIALIGMMCLVTGCKKTPQQIFSEQKSGVVLICNKFYYEITLNNTSSPKKSVYKISETTAKNATNCPTLKH